MKIRAQISMVLNLDKCIGCHTCSVVCKNVWTSREGIEYGWFNNVETKPGRGFPRDWEDQEKWHGGWQRTASGLTPRMGGKLSLLAKIFANPHMPSIEDYYEPYSFDYTHLHTAPAGARHQPTARPYSLLTGKTLEKIEGSANWEDDLGGEAHVRQGDPNLEGLDKQLYAQFEQTFMMYLPRLCEHCLNPACVASCPSGAIYKRAEDGVVLINQDQCRGWRMCVSACPYKKIYYNWKSGKSEKCIFCYPRIEAGLPTLCSESCVGRIRYIGVMLYDAEAIPDAAAVEDPHELYQAQMRLFLDPHDAQVIEQARRDGISDDILEHAQRSPVYRLIKEWQLALPLHPEFRTLPMVWYVPPLSPIRFDDQTLATPHDIRLAELEQMRIPIHYLAKLLCAGDRQPVERALTRLIALRHYRRSLLSPQAPQWLQQADLSSEQAEAMYRLLALAPYHERFVIPTGMHQPASGHEYIEHGSCGFSFNTPHDVEGTNLTGYRPDDRLVINLRSKE